MFRGKLVLSLLLSLASAGAEASVIDSDGYYAVDVHYSTVAYGKAVASVLAHLGVETRHPVFTGRPDTWQDVSDVTLEKGESGFVGRVGLRAQGYSGSISATLTPVIQYFVSFQDGTSLISEVQPIAIEGRKHFCISYDLDRDAFVMAGLNAVRENRIPDSTRVVFQADLWGYSVPSERLNEAIENSGLPQIYQD
jgi:hypothetical protein